MAEAIELRAVIENLRQELGELNATAGGERLRFTVESVEVELKVGVTREAGANGKVSFKVFGIGAEVGGDGKYTSEQTQVITLKLTPTIVEPGKREAKVLLRK